MFTSNLLIMIKRKNARSFKAKVQQDIVKSETCNCRDKIKCSLDGVYKTGVVYKAEINDLNDQNKVYAGCAEGSFKKRWYIHKS